MLNTQWVITIGSYGALGSERQSKYLRTDAVRHVLTNVFHGNEVVPDILREIRETFTP